MYTICGSLGEVISPTKLAHARTSLCLATCTETPLFMAACTPYQVGSHKP